MTDTTSRRRLLRIAAAGAAGGTGLLSTANARRTDVGAGTDPTREAPYHVFTVEKSGFVPELLRIPVGATVTFVGNRYPHTITSAETAEDAINCNYSGEDVNDKYFKYDDDGVIRYTVESADEPYNVYFSSSDVVEMTYEAAGEYPYFCEPHCGSFMVGKLIVSDPS